MKTLILWTPGCLEYGKAWEQQQRLHSLRRKKNIPDTLIILEHPHVYTIGRHGDRNNILFDDKSLKEKKISVYKIDRGGDVTYHGPGQLVGYPIFNYCELGYSTRRFVHSIEEVIIRYLHSLGLNACRDPRYPGVWIGKNKICAIGLRVSEDVSMHGFALNIKTSPEYFSGIIACGIQDRGVTSLKDELVKIKRELPASGEILTAITGFFREMYGYNRIQSVSGPIPFSDLSG
jgi:lipoate-protein ligase B